MDRRAAGIETEYGVQFAGPEARPLAADEVARYLFRPVVAWGDSSNVFVPNGSRLYLDVGSHPEYATAECSTALELIASDKAGDAIMNRLIERAQPKMAEDGFHGRVILYRNNADSRGNSYGSHENYQITRNTQFRRLAEALIPFLVTRPLIAGAGVVVNRLEELPELEGFTLDQDQPHFAFSQRADYVQDGISSSSTRARPIINTRDEPHADSGQFRRLHVIVGDSNMSETTQLLRFGATDLMLRMIEAGVPLPDFELSHPVRSIRAVSHDLSGNGLVELRNGTTLTALEVQQHFLAIAQDFLTTQDPLHDYMPQVMDLWERTLNAIETQNFSTIDTEIDWAIKYRFLSGYAQRNDLGWDSFRLKQLDMSYHDIDPGKGLFNLLVQRGAAARVLTDDDVDHAIDHAPTSTRATLRHEFICTARAHNMGYSVDWSHMKLNDFPLRTIYLKDPLLTESKEMDELLSQLGPLPTADTSFQNQHWI